MDSNVLLDWLVFRDPRVARLAGDVTKGAVRWIASPPMLDELEHVLTRAEIALRGPDRAQIDRLIARHAIRVEAVATPWQPALRCTDPDDQKFLDLALHHGANWLLTRDKALLRLARRARERGLAIATPDDWPA